MKSSFFFKFNAYFKHKIGTFHLLINFRISSDKECESDHRHYLGGSSEYMHSFGAGCSGLGSIPFWSGTNTMTIGTNDGASDVDAYQFGMGDVITPGSIKLSPVVQHFGTELLYYYQHHTDAPGFVAKIWLPVGGMKIDAQLCEDPALLDLADDTQWLEYPAGTNRWATLSDAFHGGTCSGGKTHSGSSSSVNKPIALDKGRISPCALTRIACADLSVTLGYNVINKKNWLLMLGAKATLPTGNVPNARHIFEPFFGRAGHFGLGAEFAGACKKYHWKDINFDFYVQGEVLHLFSGIRPSWRSFDLAANGPGSKYLLTQFYFPGNADTTATPSNPTGRIPSFITQAVNITTFPVYSSFSAEGSFAAMLNAVKGNWSVGVGAEFWGRSHENLCIDCCNTVNYDMVGLNDYAVLGRQISVNSDNDETLTLCEPLARINKSQDRVTSTSDTYDTAKIKDARVSANRIPANPQEALDICGAQQPASMSGKVLLATGYNWTESDYKPNLTAFVAAEFANKSMINFWSVGLKGSVNF